MPSETNVLLVDCICFVFLGLLFIGLSIPMVLRKIPPNSWYGWRTPKAYESPEIWYEINRYAGRDFLVMGAVQVIYNVLLLCLWGLMSNPVELLVVIGNVVLLGGGTIVIIVRGFRYLGRL